MKPAATAPPASKPAPEKPVAEKAPPVATAPSAGSPAVLKPKKERLDALLQRYVKDEITAQEYHRERAKILAEP